jgi:endonuclease/exonuclease/phosphatase family metal-dependent hydrolase
MSTATRTTRPAMAPAARPTAPRAQYRKPLSLAAWLVIGLTWLYLLAMAGLWYTLFVTSEDWWVGSILTYLPRAIFLLPGLVLLVASLLWHPTSAPANVLSLALVAIPIMEFHWPTPRITTSTGSIPSGNTQLSVVSCNVQAYKPHFRKILKEVATAKPDVVAFQEARGVDPLAEEFFSDWHYIHHDYYLVASRYPVKLIRAIDTTPYERCAGIIVEVDHPTGPMLFANIHQMTARRALKEVSPRSLLDGEAQAIVEQQVLLRIEEASQLREAIEQVRERKPLVVLGDFNTPSSSSVYRTTWGDFTNSFDAAGAGYGYTSPVKRHSYWLEDTPWARIDHIICSPDWYVTNSRIGTSNGSDHHLIQATLAR